VDRRSRHFNQNLRDDHTRPCVPIRAARYTAVLTAHGTPIERQSPAFRRTTLALFSAGFSTFALMYCVQPLLPEFAREFALTPAASSLAVSLTTGCLALAMLVVGALSETWGRKPLMVTSLTLAAALTVLSAAAPTWHAFLAIRALEGLVFAGLPAIAMAYVGEEIDARALGLAMGIYVGGTALGGMVGRLLTAVLTDVATWRLALAVMGGVGLGAAALVASSLPASTQFRARAFTPAHSARAYLDQLRDPVLAMLYLQGFVFMGAFVAVYNYISFRLIEPPYSFSQARAGSIFLLYLVGTISSPWAGAQAHLHGRARTLALTVGLMLAGVLLTLASATALVALGIGVLTFGFFGAHSVTSGWVGSRASERKAQASSLYLCSYYLGASVTGALGGLFWGHWHWNGLIAFLVATLLLALAFTRVLARRERPVSSPGAFEAAPPAGA
jgi:YNFM family putative membrane transporter